MDLHKSPTAAISSQFKEMLLVMTVTKRQHNNCNTKVLHDRKFINVIATTETNPFIATNI